MSLRRLRGAWRWIRGLSTSARLWLLLALLGYGIRIGLAFFTVGSNDTTIWRQFAEFVRQHGLYASYVVLHPPQHIPLNHPPLAVLYMTYASQLAEHLPFRNPWWIKFPGLCGEVLTAGVLWRLHGGAAAPARAARATAAYALSLCAILASGFHGNTDCAYAGLMLLGVYLLQERESPLLAGLAFAAALNVKLIPVFVVLPAIALSPSIRGCLRLLAGLAVGAIPFLFPLLNVPVPFLTSVFTYRPGAEYWGLEGLGLLARTVPAMSQAGPAFNAWYGEHYRVFLAVPVVLAIAYARRTGRWTVLQTSTLCLLAFLILTPGFGVQYTVVVCPLAFAVSVGWGTLYSWLAGVGILTVYVHYTLRVSPWYSEFYDLFPPPARVLLMASWGVLIAFAVRLALLRRPGESRVSSPPLGAPPLTTGEGAS